VKSSLAPRRSPCLGGIAKNLANTFGGRTGRAKRIQVRPASKSIHRGRGALRAILGGFWARAGGAAFEYQQTATELAGEFRHAGIHFNLAHTEDLALVDVDAHRCGGSGCRGRASIKNAMNSSPDFFHRGKMNFISESFECRKPAAFSICGRQRSVAKGHREGITRSLSLDGGFVLPVKPPRLLAVSGMRKGGAMDLRSCRPRRDFGCDCDSGEGCDAKCGSGVR